MIKTKTRLSIEGKVNYIKTISSTTGEEKTYGPFKNVILDRFFTEVGVGATVNAVMDRLQVGSGSTPPTEQDTTLESPVATTSTRQNTVRSLGGNENDGFFTTISSDYRFSVGQAAGNLSEAGLASFNVGIEWLITRVLITDAQGQPTTITVLPDEELVVNYELKVNWNLADSTIVTDIGGVSTTVRTLSSQVESANQDWTEGAVRPRESSSIGYWAYSDSYDVSDITQNPITGSRRSIWSSVLNTSINGGLGQRYTMVSGATFANDAPIAIICGSYGNSSARNSFCITFDPPINKTNQDQLTLVMDYTWERG